MKNNLSKMKSLDMYLSQLSEKDHHTIKETIEKRDTPSLALHGWGLFMESYQQRVAQMRKEHDLKYVAHLAAKFNWKNNLEQAFREHDYEALIITDSKQNIIWVNDGFKAMTGYPKAYAINKSPRFLQGRETLPETKQRIREKIASNKPFRDIITNHRKDKSTYKCEVNIIPLYDTQTTHFIAFEKEVR